MINTQISRLVDNYNPSVSNPILNNCQTRFTQEASSIFTQLIRLNETKSYISITGCLLELILHSCDSTNQEKLFYILADSLSLINHNKGKQRSVTLSARQWANKLDCSVAEIFAMQQSLERKGYFEISRGKNKGGKNMKNVITPTLPDPVFNLLVNTPNRFNIKTSPSFPTSTSIATTSYAAADSDTYLPHLEGKRAYLDRTKMFIKLNYQLLSLITSYEYLSNYSKVMWLDFYSIGYRYYLKHRACGKNTTNLDNMETNDNTNLHKSNNFNIDDSYSLTTTYQELQDKYSCSKSVISKTLKELETVGFITRKRFFVKNDDEDDNLHDKSIWRITVTVPDMMQQQLQKEAKDRSKPASGKIISNSDPYVSNSSQYINKYFKSSIKDLDNIDSGKSFFEKVDDFSPETSSELSVFYKNSLEKEISSEFTALSQTTYCATLNNLENNENQQGRVLEINSLDDFVNDSIDVSTSNSTSSWVTNEIQDKPLKQDQTLKSFYPLTKEQVGKLNHLSRREFSNNFANQLLLKLYCRDPNKRFASKNHMISYMSKAFRYEKHQAPMVNHETFRFTVNTSDPESVADKQREKYLEEVEYSIDTSYSSQLRKKIAGIFEPKLAYRLLTEVEYQLKYQELQQGENQQYTPIEQQDKQDKQDQQTQQQEYEENQEQNQYKEQRQQTTQEFNEFRKSLNIINSTEETWTVQLPKDLTLTYHQEEALENAIISVYGKIDICYEKMATKSWNIDKKSPVNNDINIEDLDKNSIWYKIRQELRQELGEFVDKTWLSKLTAQEDIATNTLTLYAPTNFIRDWINGKYCRNIKICCEMFNINLGEILTSKN